MYHRHVSGRFLVGTLLLVTSCAEGEVVYIHGIPETPDATALLVGHHDHKVDAFVYALPMMDPIRPPIWTADRSASLELLLFSEPVEALFPAEGRLLPGTGMDPLPKAESIYTLPLLGGADWEKTGRTSAEIDAFLYQDPRPDPCRVESETISLQTESAIAELLEGDAGDVYAVAFQAPGLFRLRGSTSTPIEVVPPVGAQTATLDGDRLWVVTSTGAVMAGSIENDRVELLPQVGSPIIGLRWLIPNPYGDGVLGMSRSSQLIDVTDGRVLHQLPNDHDAEQGTLIYSGAVYFTTIQSPVVGRWDGQSFEEIPIPDDLGGAVRFVPGLGILVGAFSGQIFRLDGHQLVPLVATHMENANTIVPFPDGFVVASDVGSLFRWTHGDRTCDVLGLSVENLDLGGVFQGGAAFAPISPTKRAEIGGPTPVTVVRPR